MNDEAHAAGKKNLFALDAATVGSFTILLKCAAECGAGAVLQYNEPISLECRASLLSTNFK